MRIVVTQEDIDAGIENIFQIECPVGLAITRALGDEYRDICMSWSDVYIAIPDKADITLPKVVFQWVTQATDYFDDRTLPAPQPFEFDLNVK